MFTPHCVTEKSCKDPSEKNAATNLRKVSFSPCIGWIQHSTGRAGVNGKKTQTSPKTPSQAAEIRYYQTTGCLVTLYTFSGQEMVLCHRQK